MPAVPHCSQPQCADTVRPAAQRNSRGVALWGLAASLALAVLCPLSAHATSARSAALDSLAEAPLEDLLSMTVTSVSRKAQSLATAASAVQVLTHEEIRRSGASTLPDLLRQVPGLDVAQIDGSAWQVSARGFAGRYSNKMLVLIDGRSVYTALFSGVYWDEQDVPFDDIDRIEVIRGPGATAWGANAVNGVINVITRSSQDTQGGLATVSGGSQNHGGAGLRWGGALSSNLTYRLSGSFAQRSALLGTGNVSNSGDVSHGVLRADWRASDQDRVRFDVGLHGGSFWSQWLAPTLTAPYAVAVTSNTPVDGGHIVATWDHSSDADHGITATVLRDWTHRPQDVGGTTLSSMEAGIQSHRTWGSRQDLVLGVGIRNWQTTLKDNFMFSLTSATTSTTLINAFVQDEISLRDNQLALTLGTKIEHTSADGVNWEPSGRLLYRPTQELSVWAAVSHAIRTPSMLERFVTVPLGAQPGPYGTTLLVLNGNPDIKSEVLDAREIGTRFSASSNVSMDLTGFSNNYSRVRGTVLSTPVLVPGDGNHPQYVIQPLAFGNFTYGPTYGAEALVRWTPSSRARLSAGYTWFRANLRSDVADNGEVPILNGSAPSQQLHLGLSCEPMHAWEVDTHVFAVGRVAWGNVPAYTRVDARVGFSGVPGATLSVGDQNALQASHVEAGYQGDFSAVRAIPRLVYGQATFGW